MRRFQIATALAVLGLVPSIGVLSEDGRTGDRPGVEVEGSWGEMEGPGGFAPIGFWRRTPDFRTGSRAQLDATWWFQSKWNVQAGVGRGKTRYETPVDPVCPLSLTSLLGPPPGAIGCSFGHPTPLVGNIEDRFQTWHIGLGFRHAYSDWLAVSAHLGYARMDWDSDEDTEARALTECIAIGQSSLPVLREDCVKVSSTSRRDGLIGNIGLTWSPYRRFEVRVAWHAQRFRYHVYRNEVVPRVVAANCPETDACFVASQARVVPIEDGSWSWLGARATWRFNERWAVFVNHEDGGSRPWQTTDVGLRLRF